MENKVMEIEATSLNAAREQAKANITKKGLRIVSEKILSDGKEQTVNAVADSVSAAFEIARGKIPEGAQVLKEHEMILPSQKSMEVEAFDEKNARTLARQMVDSTARIETLTMKKIGKKGFLGIGKKPHLYQVDISQPAVVSISFQLKARIRVEVGEIPSTGYCQMCGRSNSPAEKSQSSIYFFCSSSCRERYFKSKIASIVFSPNTFILNSSGQDLSGIIASGRANAAQATAYCWFCGKLISMSKDTCSMCGNEQEIKI